MLLPMCGTTSLFFRKARFEIVKLVLFLWTVLAAFIKLSVVPMRTSENSYLLTYIVVRFLCETSLIPFNKKIALL